MRDKLRTEKRGSKGLWRIANRIMEKQCGQEVIPALKNADAVWVRDPLEKANLFARTFSSKFSLQVLETNEFRFDLTRSVAEELILVRSSHVGKIFDKMDVDSGTGPDMLATRVLKECYSELRLPLAKLIRRIMAEGFWPTAWTIHWLMPLYKRKSVSDPNNYRAINLTAQISKAVERYLSSFFVPVLEARAFGQS